MPTASVCLKLFFPFCPLLALCFPFCLVVCWFCRIWILAVLTISIVNSYFLYKEYKKYTFFSDFTFCCLTLSFSIFLFPACYLVCVLLSFCHVTFCSLELQHYTRRSFCCLQFLFLFSCSPLTVCFFNYFTTLLG